MFNKASEEMSEYEESVGANLREQIRGARRRFSERISSRALEHIERGVGWVGAPPHPDSFYYADA